MVINDEHVNQYIAAFPESTQKILQKIRKIFHTVVPDGTECISYGIPTIKMNGTYVAYMSGWKHHVSIYPIPPDNPSLAKEFAPYVAGKGTLRFDLDKPIPYDLIQKVVIALLAHNNERVGRKTGRAAE